MRLMEILFGRPLAGPKTEAGLAFRDAYYFKAARVILGAVGLDWDSAAVIAARIAEEDDIEAFANMDLFNPSNDDPPSAA